MRQSILILIGVACALFAARSDAADPKPEPGGSIVVEVVGVIHTGIVAVGGETTGTTVAAEGVTWELDLAGNDRWMKLAEANDGKELVVKGTLHTKAGVERPGKRSIVTVTALLELTH